jgi:hypothetical protein
MGNASKVASGADDAATDLTQFEMVRQVRYLPPPAVMKKLIRRTTGLAGKETVAMAGATYAKLIETLLVGIFDPDAYLKRFPDIKTAIDEGRLGSALEHFLLFGYGESRAPMHYQVDEAWYLATYPDVAEAVNSGKIKSATQHFDMFGYAEGRAPNKSFEKIVNDWREIERRYAMDR